MKCLDALVGLSILACAPAAHAATFSIVNDDTRNAQLRDAIAAANLTAEADTIVLPAPATPGDPPVRFDFGGAPESDTLAGAVVLTAITSDITIEGAGVDQVILSASGVDATLFVVRTDPTLPINGGLELPAKLTLRSLTVDRGRGTEAGAVVVRAEPPPTGELPRLVANNVAFVDHQGATAGAILNIGGPLSVTGCTFIDNVSEGAGALSTSSGGSIGTSTFSDNQGRVGAIEAPAATFTDDLGAVVPAALSISACTFADNEGSDVGAVRSLADTGIGNSSFVENRASGDNALGGAVQASHVRAVGCTFDTNTSRRHGGALALIVDADGAPGSVAFSDFLDNIAFETAGAVYAQGVALTVADSTFSRNIAADGGGGIAAGGASLDVDRSRFSFNRARAVAAFLGADVSVDERGDDTGLGQLRLAGAGSAVRLDAGASFSFAASCFIGNAATAVLMDAGATGTLDGNFWGDAGGPNAGDTLVAPGLPAPTFLDAPPEICDPAPDGGGNFVDVPMTVRDDSMAQIGIDFRVLRAGTGVTLMTSTTDIVQVPERSGAVDLEVRGVNDLDQEGEESLVLRLVGCQGGLGSCPDFTSDGSPEVGFSITDNGDGVGEGEGEGEGECADELKLSARALVFEDKGSEPSTQKLEVTNAGVCELQLIAPLVRKGASLGFSVNIVPQAELLLAPGDKLSLTVTYQRPEEDPDAKTPEGYEGSDEPPSGQLVVESLGGARFEVPLTLQSWCGCATTSAGAPWLALALLALGAPSVSRGRRRAR